VGGFQLRVRFQREIGGFKADTVGVNINKTRQNITAAGVNIMKLSSPAAVTASSDFLNLSAFNQDISPDNLAVCKKDLSVADR